MKRLGFATFILILFCACNKTKPDTAPEEEPPAHENPEDKFKDFKSYIIRKGNNYCDNNTYDILVEQPVIDIMVVFDSSCIYTNVDPVNQMDINKLIGFSDCNTHHQTNSARFGWNWQNDALHLHAYCYVNSERLYKDLGTVPLNEAQHLKMKVIDNGYLFELNEKTDTMLRNCNGTSITGYQLLPYFGGDETAPQDITIRIKQL